MNKTILISCGLALTSISCGNIFRGRGDAKMEQQDAALAHSWKASCAKADVLELTHTRRKIRLGVLGNFDRFEHFYGSDACNDSQMEYKVSGTYATLGENKDNSDVKNINFTVNKATIKVTSKATVDVMNRLKLCEISDWKLNEEVNITNKKCTGFSVKRGDVIFDVYEVKDKSLYFGKKLFFLSGDNAADRPNEVATDVEYIR
jgi:hypothetical protein